MVASVNARRPVLSDSQCFSKGSYVERLYYAKYKCTVCLSRVRSRDLIRMTRVRSILKQGYSRPGVSDTQEALQLGGGRFVYDETNNIRIARAWPRRAKSQGGRRASAMCQSLCRVNWTCWLRRTQRVIRTGLR